MDDQHPPELAQTSSPQAPPPWVEWSKRLQAMAQNGLTFSRDPYDTERYKAIRELAAEMLAQGSGLSLDVVRGVLGHDTGYATPKVDMRAVVFRGDGRLLLVRERNEGLWSLPGGWADPGESPAENVVREVREETGFTVRATKLLAVFDRARHPHFPPFAYHVYKMFVRCEITGGQETLSTETDAIGFFGEEEVPPLSISRVTPGQIRRMFEHARDTSLPTDFDLGV